METRIAIIGSGFGMYGLLPAFSKVKGCRVVSICGKNSNRMQNYCKKIGLRRYTNWKKMLEKEKPDAIAIAVIPTHQYEIAKYALENNIAVFAEKPLTTSVKTCLELTKLAAKKKIPNMIDFIFPEISEWQKTKKLIENEAIGKILDIKVNWTFMSHDIKNRIKSWKTDVEQGGGALSFYFSHVLYYLEYFIGKIKSIQCLFSSSNKSLNKGETVVNMIILFENGCIGSVHMNICHTGRQSHTIEFHGEDGTIELQNNSSDFIDNFELIINNKKMRQIHSNKTVHSLSYIDPEDTRIKVVRPIAQRFTNWCNDGVVARPDFQDGLRIQKLIEAARISNLKFHKYK